VAKCPNNVESRFFTADSLYKYNPEVIRQKSGILLILAASLFVTGCALVRSESDVLGEYELKVGNGKIALKVSPDKRSNAAGTCTYAASQIRDPTWHCFDKPDYPKHRCVQKQHNTYDHTGECLTTTLSTTCAQGSVTMNAACTIPATPSSEWQTTVVSFPCCP
jgi:hypothetical protein